AAGGKGGGNGDAVSAVAVEEQGRGAVERRTLLVDERNRHRLAVGRGGKQPARHVVGGVVPARDLLRLTQKACARLHVVVEHLRRRRHRGIGKAQGGGVELVKSRHAQRIGLLIEGDGVLGIVLETAHDDARQAVF